MQLCTQCGRCFRIHRGCYSIFDTAMRLRKMKKLVTPPKTTEVSNNYDPNEAEQQFFWGSTPGNKAVRGLKSCYDELIFWRKNLYMLPKGSSGKEYFNEITRLINEWLVGSPIREYTMCAVHIMPVPLL